jgi:hypothetical protein
MGLMFSAGFLLKIVDQLEKKGRRAY